MITPNETMSNIKDFQGRYYETIDFAKINLNFKVKIDDMFWSKEVLLNAIWAIAIRDNFQFQTIKSDKQVLVLSCLLDGCKGSLCARSIGDDGNCTWVIRRFDHEHSCSLDIAFSSHMQA